MQEGFAVVLIVIAIFAVNLRAFKKKAKEASAPAAPQKPAAPHKGKSAPKADWISDQRDTEFSSGGFGNPYEEYAYSEVQPKRQKEISKTLAHPAVSAQDLRSAVIMSEILGKPVSMRESE